MCRRKELHLEESYLKTPMGVITTVIYLVLWAMQTMQSCISTMIKDCSLVSHSTYWHVAATALDACE